MNETWKTLEPSTGTASTGRYAPRYKKVNGVVFLQGAIREIIEGDTLFTLPEGYRPSNRLSFVTSTDTTGKTNVIRILENGNVNVFKLADGIEDAFLDGIIYPAD